MNKTIPISNTGASPIWVGPIMIAPGETRVFEPHELPPGYARQAAPAAKPEAPPAPEGMAALVLNSVKEIELALPDLTESELQELEQLEEAKAKNARKGVLAAIQKEQLLRAEHDEFVKGLDGLTEGDLVELLVGYPEGSVEHGLIAERIEALAHAAGKDGTGEGGE